MNFDSLRRNSFNQWVIIHLRYLVGSAFLPSGLVKLMGERFTQISPDTPIGYFFEALYQSGGYWNFLGFTQVVAGILLMTQRFAALGALLFFGILSNIWVITISLSFKGTWIITSLMMIAITILLIWDKYKLLPIFSYNKTNEIKIFPDPERIWIVTGIIYACCFITLYLLSPISGSILTKWISAVFCLIIVAAFMISNYKAYKTRQLIVNT